jgi:hypothetical protein
MLNRVASASCLTIALAIFPNQMILAESININFSGTVAPRASFGSSTPGRVESTISSKSAQSRNQFKNITPATISVQTSAPATVTISSPTLVSASRSNIGDTKHSASLRIGSSKVSGDNVTLLGGKNIIGVDMSLKETQAFIPGTYTYSVMLTIVNP